MYEEWKSLGKNHDFKRVGKSSDEVVVDRLSKTVYSEEILDWINDVKCKIPSLCDFMDFITVLNRI